VYKRQTPDRAATPNGSAVDLFAEMEPYTVRRGDADDSREGVYRRAPDE
jgi:hypothetical protein